MVGGSAFLPTKQGRPLACQKYILRRQECRRSYQLRREGRENISDSNFASICLEGNTSVTGYIHEQSEWMCPE